MAVAGSDARYADRLQWRLWQRHRGGHVRERDQHLRRAAGRHGAPRAAIGVGAEVDLEAARWRRQPDPAEQEDHGSLAVGLRHRVAVVAREHAVRRKVVREVGRWRRRRRARLDSSAGHTSVSHAGRGQGEFEEARGAVRATRGGRTKGVVERPLSASVCIAVHQVTVGLHDEDGAAATQPQGLQHRCPIPPQLDVTCICEAEHLAFCVDHTVTVSNILSRAERAAKVMAHIGGLVGVRVRVGLGSGSQSGKTAGGSAPRGA